MIYEIQITADHNDADYTTVVREITEEQLKIIKPLIRKIKKFEPYKTKTKKGWRTHDHNFPTVPIDFLGEKTLSELYVTKEKDEEALDLFQDFLPYQDDYSEIHTIVSVYVYPKPKKTRLL